MWGGNMPTDNQLLNLGILVCTLGVDHPFVQQFTAEVAEQEKEKEKNKTSFAEVEFDGVGIS